MHNHPQQSQTALIPASLLRLVLVLGALSLVACKPSNETTQATAGPDNYFPIQIGDSTLHLQLALTPSEHQKGLMFRESLPPDSGMLFLFSRAGQQSFWMKNTQIPLDIGYLDASGRLLEIHQLFPHDETGVASRSAQILMAIETNRGWYAANEITPGARLDMEALKQAVARRGHSIDTYAIED